MTEQLNENLTKEQMKETLGDLADYMAKTFPDWNAYCQAVQIFIEHGQLQKRLDTVTAERDAALLLLGEVKQPIYNDQWDVCWYCEEWCGNDYDNIPHKPDCLTVRIKTLLAKEDTQ